MSRFRKTETPAAVSRVATVLGQMLLAFADRLLETLHEKHGEGMWTRKITGWRDRQ